MLFHFRGHTEQGVATAARIFGRAAVLSNQRCNAWIPEHGHGIGNGISAFTKIDKEESFEYGPADPKQADFTIVFEPSLIDPRYLRDGSVLIVNSREKPRDGRLKKKKIRILAIDALEHVSKGKKVFPNLILLGFLAAQFKKVQLKSLKQAVNQEFDNIKEKSQEIEAGFKVTPKK